MLFNNVQRLRRDCANHNHVTHPPNSPMQLAAVMTVGKYTLPRHSQRIRRLSQSPSITPILLHPLFIICDVIQPSTTQHFLNVPSLCFVHLEATLDQL